MRQRPMLLILVAVLTGMVGLVLILSHHREPSFNGQSLTYWCNQFTNTDANVQRQSADAIRQIGTNALPILLERITHHAPRWQIWLYVKLVGVSTQPWGRWIPFRDAVDPNLWSFSGTIQAFNALGPTAGPAIPRLFAIAKNSRGRANLAIQAMAVHAMTCIGPASVPALLDIATDKSASKDMRVEAIMGIANPRHQDPGTDQLGYNAPLIFAALAQNLQDPDEEVVLTTEHALGILNAESVTNRTRNYRAP